ncbi:hypothetical protein [Mycoplasma elephantis]|uniref:hypothetical protein n=1 Tax=Mycoplasma elephantis TaxID=114882 RepID=UPI000487691F|nr:hypothetical protein [Mycoplasma elephantis]
MDNIQNLCNDISYYWRKIIPENFSYLFLISICILVLGLAFLFGFIRGIFYSIYFFLYQSLIIILSILSFPILENIATKIANKFVNATEYESFIQFFLPLINGIYLFIIFVFFTIIFEIIYGIFLKKILKKPLKKRKSKNKTILFHRLGGAGLSMISSMPLVVSTINVCGLALTHDNEILKINNNIFETLTFKKAKASSKYTRPVMGLLKLITDNEIVAALKGSFKKLITEDNYMFKVMCDLDDNGKNDIFWIPDVDFIEGKWNPENDIFLLIWDEIGNKINPDDSEEVKQQKREISKKIDDFFKNKNNKFNKIWDPKNTGGIDSMWDEDNDGFIDKKWIPTESEDKLNINKEFIKNLSKIDNFDLDIKALLEFSPWNIPDNLNFEEKNKLISENNEISLGLIKAEKIINNYFYNEETILFLECILNFMDKKQAGIKDSDYFNIAKNYVSFLNKKNETNNKFIGNGVTDINISNLYLRVNNEMNNNLKEFNIKLDEGFDNKINNLVKTYISRKDIINFDEERKITFNYLSIKDGRNKQYLSNLSKFNDEDKLNYFILNLYRLFIF